MKTLLAVLLFASVASADVPVIELTPGGDTAVYFDLTNTTGETLTYGDYGANSHGAVGSCDYDWFAGTSAFTVCEDFAGDSGTIEPGDTVAVRVLNLYAALGAEPGFSWHEDVSIFTTRGRFDYQFEGRIVSPPATEVPEPATIGLMLTGLAGVAARLRRKK